MLHFENPAAFIFLSAPLIFYILWHFGILSRFSFSITLSDWGGKSFERHASIRNFFSYFSNLLAFFSFILLVISLSNPVIRHQEKIYTSRGTDILFVLDVSPSMAARDISLVNGNLTRLEAAKIGIQTIVSAENGASYGLVAMASEAACIVPPTSDKKNFLQRLLSLEPGEFGEGSAIGIGLSTALYHLSGSPAPKKCMVLITDGENNAGQIHPETAANLARENGISLYAFGIGTKGSVPIEYVDKKTGRIRSGFYESDFDSAPLEKIAMIAGGAYFGIESTASLSDALSMISRNEESVQTFYYRSNDAECYRIFLILSIICAVATFFIKRIFLAEIL